MSSGEVLRVAVQQKIMVVLEEVLGMIQTTVDQYEAQLRQYRVTEEESERLTGARALLLLGTETVEKSEEQEKELNETCPQPIVKVEEPDLWSISETQIQPRELTSGPKNAPPQAPLPTTTTTTTTQPQPHEQSHENPTSKHTTESGDSDEECPICKQLGQRQELTEPGVSSATDNQTLKQKEKLEPQEFENTEVKMEGEDQGYLDQANDREHLQQNFPNTSAIQDRDMTSHCRKPASEMKDEMMETETVIDSRLDPEKPAEATNSQQNFQNTAANQDKDMTSECGKPSSEMKEEITETETNLSSTRLDQEKVEEAVNSQPIFKSMDANVDQDMTSECRNTSSEINEVTMETEKNISSRLDQEKSEEALNPEQNSKNVAANQDQGMTSECSKTTSEIKTVVSEETIRSSLEINLKEAMDNSTMDAIDTKENGGKTVDAPNSSQLSNRVEKGQCLNQESEKSRIIVSKCVDDAYKMQENLNGQEVEEAQKDLKRSAPDLDQEIPSKCRIISSETTEKAMESEKGVATSFEKATMEQENIISSKTPNSSSAKEELSANATSASSRPKEAAQVDEHCDILLRKQQKRKAKTKAKTDIQNYAKAELESASDVNESNRNSKDLTTAESSEGQSTKSSVSKRSENSQSSNSKTASNQDSAKSNSSAVRKNTGKFKCLECGDTFVLKGNLMKHQVVHREERPFSCSQCDATFKRKLNLKAHMTIHSEEKEFECTVCKKKYTRRANLLEHMKGHGGKKPFPCPMCDRAFTCSSNLRRHKFAHSNLRPFKCEICGKSFGRKSILREHVAAHSRVYRFRCSICKNKFSRKSNLLKHMRLHDGDRRFKCSECGLAFTQNAHLNQHMLQHTGEKPYSCPVCRKSFTRKAYVQQHRDMYCLGAAQEENSAPVQTRTPGKVQANKQGEAAKTQEKQNSSKAL
ncbi:hypothetical protein WMY93_014784 [Mugilogobius chulae]|uniref:C2H2-type domain-containing protein n=1 Tax=Mugilogobius chulae TaxID=88201 RepID=A0AAW0P7K9_9GOBI